MGSHLTQQTDSTRLFLTYLVGPGDTMKEPHPPEASLLADKLGLLRLTSRLGHSSDQSGSTNGACAPFLG